MNLNFRLISPIDAWGYLECSLCHWCFRYLRSERTKIGSALSGALVSTFVALAASNLGIISCESPAYYVVLKFLLPLTVPLMLFRADLCRVIQFTGTLLLAFLFGSVVHYVAILDALGVSPSVLDADNVSCAVYFMSLLALASKIPPESSTSINDAAMDDGSESGNKLPVLQTATALTMSFVICRAGAYTTKFFAIQGGILPVVTAIVVILATVFPTQFNHLAPSGSFCCGWCKWKRMECDQHRAQHFHVCIGPDCHSSCRDPWIGKAISLRPKTVANCIKC